MSRDDYQGIPIVVSRNIPDGPIMVAADPIHLIQGVNPRASMNMTVIVGPLTYWRLKHPGRDPFLSKFNPGTREIRRDRRKR